MAINNNRFLVKNGLDNNSKTITNVADPVNASDAATRAYVLANAGGSISLSDDTSTNSAHYLTLTSSTSGTLNALKVSSSKLSFNPSTGNLGLGAAFSASTLTGAIENNFGLVTRNSGAIVSNNLQYNSGWKYLGNGYGGVLRFDTVAGDITFISAPNNTGGAGIAATTAIPFYLSLLTGNVGIGTANPDSLSPVFGSLSKLGAYNSAGVASMTIKGTGNPNWFSVLSLTSDETTDKEWYIGHTNSGLTTLNSLAFSYYNGTTSSFPMILTAAGNLGIGGTPANNLDIIGNNGIAGVWARTLNNNASTTSSCGFIVQNGNGVAANFATYNNFALINVTSAHILEFRTSNTPRANIHATTGEFCIGNFAAQTNQGRLQTYDTLAGGAVASARFINSSGTANSAVALSLDPGGNGVTVRDSQIRAMNNGSNQTNLSFWTANAAAPTEKVRIDHTGRMIVGWMGADLTNGGTGVYGASRIAGIGQHTTDIAQVTAMNFDANAAVPSWQSLNMYSHGTAAAGNLTYNPSIAAANAAELLAINKSALSIGTNTGPIGFTTGGLERMRIGATGDIQIGNANTASNTLRYFDLWNNDGGASAGCVMRFVTKNSTGTADTTFDIVKYKSGAVYLNNNDGTTGSNAIVFTTAGTERGRFDSNGMYTPHWARASGTSTAWGTTNGQLTGAFNASMGTAASATWLLSGHSNGTFRCGIQALDSNGLIRIFSNGSNFVELNGNSVVASGSITGGDLTTYRSYAATTGYLYFGNTGTKYIGFDGTNFVTTMPMNFSILGSSGSCTGNAATAGIATFQTMNFGTTGNWNTYFTETSASRRSWTESSSGGPSGTWWFIENMRHSNASNYWGRQNAWGWEDNANEFYSRNVQNGTWGSWVRFLHSGNYSSYALPLSGGTLNGNLWINCQGAQRVYGWNFASRNVYWYGDDAAQTIGLYDSLSGSRAVFDNAGNFTATGNVTAYSDPRLKENFQVIDKPLDIVNAIQGGTFTWKEGIEHTKVKAGKKDYGILADQVEAVMPEIVTNSVEMEGQSYKTVAYDKLVPVLLEAIKELEARIKVLENK